MRNIDTEAVGAVVKPKTQGFDEVSSHIRVLPVPVGLLHGEQVQIPLSVGHARPRGAAEMGHPVSGRQFAMFAAAVAEDVTVAFRRAWPSGKRGLEPGVQVGGMVGDDIDDDLDIGLVRGFGEFVEIVHGAEFRIDVAVIVDIIPAVGELAR